MKNQEFDFGEQGKKAIYFRGTREHVPLWEVLTMASKRNSSCSYSHKNVCNDMRRGGHVSFCLDTKYFWNVSFVRNPNRKYIS